MGDTGGGFGAIGLFLNQGTLEGEKRDATSATRWEVAFLTLREDTEKNGSILETRRMGAQGNPNTRYRLNEEASFPHFPSLRKRRSTTACERRKRPIRLRGRTRHQEERGQTRGSEGLSLALGHKGTSYKIWAGGKRSK